MKKVITRRPMRTVHKVCSFIKRHDATRTGAIDCTCKECPAKEKLRGHWVVKGCRVLAEELLNVAKFGNPWGKKYQRRRRYWPLPGWREGST